MDFLNNISYNSRYSDSIKLSKYTQTIENVINNICDTSNSYKTLEESIIYTYDHNTLLNSNTKLYIDQYKLKLATDIDEKSKDLYEIFNYGKQMKQKTIQMGLQKVDTLSSIIYMSDFFDTNVNIIYNNKVCKLTKHKKKDFFVEYKDSMWRPLDNSSVTNEFEIELLQDIIDINVTEYYKKFLKGIGSYKLQELINIAMEHEIDVVENKKRKTKQQLYNEININVVI